MTQQSPAAEAVPDGRGATQDASASPNAATPMADDDPYGQPLHRSLSRRSSRLSRESRRASTTEYDQPDAFVNNDDVIAPVENPDEGAHRVRRGSINRPSPEDEENELLRTFTSPALERRHTRLTRRQSKSSASRVRYDVPDDYVNLDETEISPVENPDEVPMYRHESLEDVRSQQQAEQAERRRSRSEARGRPPSTGAPEVQTAEEEEKEKGVLKVSRAATQLYTVSYLVFFSILGTLARLGLQALTYYPGAPVVFSSIWPNFAGSLVMGFLAEDRMLFNEEWGVPTFADELKRIKEKSNRDEDSAGSGSESAAAANIAAAKKQHAATKKTIPLYIGLATGFCGSFTSFSSFVRDVFLALSNDMANPNTPTIQSRNGGYSFMALLAVILLTVSMSLSGLFIGAHLAIATEPFVPAVPFLFMRKILDRGGVVLGWGCWIGAVLLAALPPDRNDPGPEVWRGRAVFAIVFAPLGCLVRFYASLYLNGRIAAFPLGTFTVNVFGSAILAMSWALAHVPLGGVVGCQVLQGIEDGFCGCLTTVSTWVAELSSLRRMHSYVYGVASVAVSLAFMVAIMGGLLWSDGFATLQCVH